MDIVNINYINNDNRLRTLTDRENINVLDYITDKCYYEYKILVDSFEEITTIKNTWRSASKAISPKANIFIHSLSSFPSLLLSRLKDSAPTLDIKRVAKEDKADNIIIDKPRYDINHLGAYEDGLFIKYPNPINPETNYYYILPLGNIFDMTDTSEIESIKNIVENLKITYPSMEIRYMINCPEWREFEICYKLITKPNITYTEDLVDYIWNKLPKPTAEEVESLCSMLKSTDKESIKQGIDLLQYYNLSDHIFNIIDSFRQSSGYPEYINTISEKYMNYILKVTRKEVYNCFNRYSYYNNSRYLPQYFLKFYLNLESKNLNLKLKSNRVFMDTLKSIIKNSLEHFISKTVGSNYNQYLDVAILEENDPDVPTSSKFKLDSVKNILSQSLAEEYYLATDKFGIRFAIIDKA